MRLAVEEELRKMRLRLHTATEQQAAANRHLERARKEVQDLRAQLVWIRAHNPVLILSPWHETCAQRDVHRGCSFAPGISWVPNIQAG